MHETVMGQRIATAKDPYQRFMISQAIRVGSLVFLSGQASIDEDGNVVGAGDFDAQAHRTFANLGAVLEAAGSSLANVVKVTIFLRNMDHFPKILELREQYFTRPYPADTIVEISRLGLPELEIEIEAIGLVGGSLLEAPL